MTASSAFDPRLIQVELQFPTGGSYTFDEGFSIRARGTRYTNAAQSACELTIFNLTRELRNTIVTQSSPLGTRTNLPNVNLRIGRQSYGTFLLYTGQVIATNVTQPPDVGITLRALTNNALQGAIAATQQPANTKLSAIAKGVASSLGATLDNQATDKQVGNFSYTGTPLDGVNKLNECGGVQAFCDNDTLVVLDAGAARRGEPRILNLATGMVGIPQVTEQGVCVKMMADNSIQLGGSVTIDSIENPAANGTWKVIKIDYEIASRENPFWYTLSLSRLAYYQGTAG